MRMMQAEEKARVRAETAKGLQIYIYIHEWTIRCVLYCVQRFNITPFFELFSLSEGQDV